MKKFSAIAVVFSLVASLSACGGNDSEVPQLLTVQASTTASQVVPGQSFELRASVTDKQQSAQVSSTEQSSATSSTENKKATLMVKDQVNDNPIVCTPVSQQALINGPAVIFACKAPSVISNEKHDLQIIATGLTDRGFTIGGQANITITLGKPKGKFEFKNSAGLRIYNLDLKPNDSGTVVLHNTGGTTISGFSLSIPATLAAYIIPNTCAASTLANGANCSFFYSIPSNAVTATYSISATGTNADNSPSTLTTTISRLGNFVYRDGNGQDITSIDIIAPATGVITVHNTGGTLISDFNLIKPPEQQGLTFSNNTCTGLDTLSPAASCSISYAVTSEIVSPVEIIATGDSSTVEFTPVSLLMNFFKEGQLMCWGVNLDGELGRGELSEPTYIPAAVTSPLSSNVIMTSGGMRGNCALGDNGTVKCWGVNADGELGDGSNVSSATPVSVVSEQGSILPLSGVTAITSGDDHSCALLQNGEVKCWGRNNHGQLGDGDETGFSKNAPVSVLSAGEASPPLTDVIAIAAGGAHTCAVEQNGQVKCWGFNEFGQLGHGSVDPESFTPVTVVKSDAGPLENITQLSLGLDHSCARDNTGTGEVWCWGENNDGQLGDGTIELRSHAANVLSGDVSLGDIKSISAGSRHTCAVKDDGGVLCWGKNGNLQLGYNTAPAELSEVPLPVTNLVEVGGDEKAIMVTSYASSTCALLSNNSTLTHRVKCWGSNSDQQLGYSPAPDNHLPETYVVNISGEVGAILENINNLAVEASGGLSACAIQKQP